MQPQPPVESDPGERGVVPFRFACQRSGRCCSAPDGYAWLAEDEPARLAAALGLPEAAFRERHVRHAPDPETGELRLALTDADGRCSLLEGANHCSVYADRPDHCQSFPYWPRVLADPAAFERARAVCPGIAPLVERERAELAFAALEALYREVDAFVARSASVCLLRGSCCRFEEAGHRLFATGLEADYAAAREPAAPPPEAAGRCPYHVGGRCTARAARPLACRTYFCDTRTESVLAEAHEHFLRRLRELERAHGYPASYGEFPAQLRARGVGVPRAPGDTPEGAPAPDRAADEADPGPGASPAGSPPRAGRRAGAVLPAPRPDGSPPP